MTDAPARAGALAGGWWRALVAVLAGLAGSFAQAPWDLTPLILVPIVAGFALLGRRAFLTGWLLGVAYFAPTLAWITEPFQIEADLHGWLAPFAAAGMAGGLALFWGVCFWAAQRLGGGLALVLTWPLGELARAYVLTGFPWAMAPQALVDTLAGQALAWLGPHGLMTALALVAWALTRRAGGRVGQVARPVLLLAAVALTTLPPVQPAPALTGHTVRLVQPNAPQRDKWNPEKIPVFVERLLQGTAAVGDPDLIVWPETALPYLLEYASPVLGQAAAAAAGKPVILGIQRRDAGRFYNSLIVLDESGGARQVYDKRHLVPFGEYMPFPALFSRIEAAGLANRVDGAFAAGTGPQILQVDGLGTAQPLICYEAVFPQLAATRRQRPDMLIQITNDAWFGAWSGPQQHLAQARMRAIEQGLPMLRAANTGISAVIGPRGRILAALPLNRSGHVDAVLPAPLPPTLYARTGDLPVALLLMLGCAILLLRRHRRPPHPQPIDPGPEGA